MQNLTSSPMRSWRWLYMFFALLFVACALYVFATWSPPAIQTRDWIVLVFPIVLLAVGIGCGYVGILARDASVQKLNGLLRQWWSL